MNAPPSLLDQPRQLTFVSLLLLFAAVAPPFCPSRPRIMQPTVSQSIASPPRRARSCVDSPASLPKRTSHEMRPPTCEAAAAGWKDTHTPGAYSAPGPLTHTHTHTHTHVYTHKGTPAWGGPWDGDEAWPRHDDTIRQPAPTLAAPPRHPRPPPPPSRPRGAWGPAPATPLHGRWRRRHRRLRGGRPCGGVRPADHPALGCPAGPPPGHPGPGRALQRRGHGAGHDGSHALGG